ncbi:MAG: hypothetical protein ACE5KS_00430, partial [Woeseiaceae bacterium]
PTLVRTFLQKIRPAARRILKKDLKIRDIYLPHIGFFAVLGLFVWGLKPYYPPAALVRGMVGKSRGVERVWSL